MRTHAGGDLPTEERITEILRRGAGPDGNSPVARRLQASCYLHANGHPLTPEERMFAQYRRDGVALLLGAGVSWGSGLPGWTKLAQQIFVRAGIPEDYETVCQAFPSLESQFDFVAQKLGSKLRFTCELYRALYANLRFKPLLEAIPKTRSRQLGWPRWREVRDELSCNRTLAAVGELLMIEEGSRFRRNPQIHAVITTNADNLLEIYCQARTGGRRRIVTMVDRASVGDHPDAISVFHLHGALDARGENFLNTPGFPDDLLPDLVFRESEYYEAIASPGAFVNDTPQSCFQRLNVLFVGTSLGDLNIRRWLYNSWSERVEKRRKYLLELYANRPNPAAYAPAAEYEARLESVRHFWFRLRREGGRDVPQPLIEDSVRNLGVQIVWCDSYQEVQEVLRRLRAEGAVQNFGRL